MNWSDGTDWKSSHFWNMQFLFYGYNAAWIHSHSFHLKEKTRIRRAAPAHRTRSAPQAARPVGPAPGASAVQRAHGYAKVSCSPQTLSLLLLSKELVKEHERIYLLCFVFLRAPQFASSRSGVAVTRQRPEVSPVWQVTNPSATASHPAVVKFWNRAICHSISEYPI